MRILEEIVARRRAKIQLNGPALGVKLPERRLVPLVPFGDDPFVICELKRSSPSRGKIAQEVDAVGLVHGYVRRGVKSISVLTEMDYFSGSLQDLIAVKMAFPHLSVLRKDFILDERDLELSFRAGADAVLLIAKILSSEALQRLYAWSKNKGMEVLLEIHDEEDLEKARSIRPSLTGINSRDLESFELNPDAPAMLAAGVDWTTRLVFESGIRTKADAEKALASGFQGLLVGEAVMKNPDLITELASLFYGSFWRKLYSRKRPNRPLVKVCGITSFEDAECVKEAGADMLGFVFAPSPRRANESLLASLKGTDVLKVGVVVSRGNPLEIEDEIKAFLETGLLDAIQFHGRETPSGLSRFSFPHYKALRLKDERSLDEIPKFGCPRVLLDAYAAGIPGGTGKQIQEALIEKAGKQYPLWIAGGIGPHNVSRIMERYRPELVDASSMLESSPGVKDHHTVELFFKEIGNAEAAQ